MKQPTISLQIITKDLTDVLLNRINDYAQYFDAIYIQVNGGRLEPSKSTGKFYFSSFKWSDDFAAARNALLTEVKTDYTCWMDSDDLLKGAEHIREAVMHMKSTGVDILFADYIYQRNEQGLPTEVQRRERIFKTGIPGEWVGAVHETFIPKGAPVTENTKLITWVHDKTKADEDASNQRNELILRKEWAREQDPRIAHYLGLCLGAQGKFDEAVKFFQILIDTGGWDEERYRAHLQIASCYQQQRKFDESAREYLAGTMELPAWPDAYYGLQQIYYEIDDHEKSIAWFELGNSCTRPDTDSAFSPIVLQLQPLLLASLSYLFVGQVTKAFNTGAKLKKLAPAYDELKKLEPEIIRAYNEEQAIEAAKTLIRFNKKYDGVPAKVLAALPATLRADVRLTEERRELIPGKEWARGSIVFYCGQGYEPWGPEYLDGGMGGSEEAVVYLARELVSQSQDNLDAPVTIYNERTSFYIDSVEELLLRSVHYLPWPEINPNDTFDTFVAWRNPSICQHIKARIKLCDVHDALSPDIIYANQEYVDKYMFKSQYHRDLYPKLPDDKCVIIGNGISKEQFK